jgi:hypothetical protein
MRRPLFISALLLAILLLGFGIALVALRARAHPLVNRANYERIAVGMSRAEVERILGKPNVELPSLATVDVVADEDTFFRRPRPTMSDYWAGGSHHISVHFDIDDRVAAKYYGRDDDAPVWDRLLDALGW